MILSRLLIKAFPAIALITVSGLGGIALGGYGGWQLRGFIETNAAAKLMFQQRSSEVINLAKTQRKKGDRDNQFEGQE